MTRTFVFRSNQLIGAAGAEHDTLYLHECFVETGDSAILSNTSDTRCLLVGRTGSGKSALLARLAETEDHVIQIKPESLALAYISNSSVLKFVAETGVKLDPFYRLLWKHVFCVELIRERFNVKDDNEKKNILDQLLQHTPRNRKHQRAIEYLKQFRDTFWEDTEYHVKELTKGFVKDLEGSLGVAAGGIELSASGARHLTEEQKINVVQRGQDVVNSAQIRELTSVFESLSEIFINDPKKKYYITVDQLDRDWIEDDVRLRLIRALIETSLDFTSMIPGVKIIVALRRDLLDRVFRYTRDAGFQEEKYRSCALDIRWPKDKLIEVLDRRINLLVRDQYTKKEVTHKDLLPDKIGRQRTIDYILERSLGRPRDVIEFFNNCIVQADGKPKVTVQALRTAEGVYSRDRLRAIEDEWSSLYPHIFAMALLLKQRPYPFAVGDIHEKELEDLVLRISMQSSKALGLDQEYLNEVLGTEDWSGCRVWLLRTLYKVGLVGLKTDPHMNVSWAFEGRSISEAEVMEDTKVFIHKAFWRFFGIHATGDEEVTSGA